MSNYVNCPLCEEGKMHLTELKSKPNGREGKSYVWVCEVCPGILLEWWDSKDTDAFVNYIENQQGIIKQWGAEKDETN